MFSFLHHQLIEMIFIPPVIIIQKKFVGLM